MTASRLDDPGGSSWRKPRESASGFSRYLDAVRQRIWLVGGLTVLTLAVAVIYLLTASKVYEGKAELLVTPISSSEPALTGLSLVRASSDPTRDVETVAQLVTSRDVAVRVKQKLGLEESVDSLTEDVSAAPVAQSNVVTLSAKQNDPDQAAQVANAFAEAAIAIRDERLEEQVKPMIEDLERRIKSGEEGTAESSLGEQLVRLEALEQSGDPTVQVVTKASPQDSPVSPRTALTLAAGLIGGLVLGLGAAFLMQALDPRLRREEQLRELYGLPILARIPRERSSGKGREILGSDKLPLGPSALSPQALEAYRTLGAMLAAFDLAGNDTDRGGRAIMVTGPSPSEGKSTTAINLASSYAMTGKRVILIEADFRRPAISAALKVVPPYGIGKVLLGEADLSKALVPIEPFGSSFGLLPAQADAYLSDLISMPTARHLLDQARAMADYVVIDSPPLTSVIDALPLARCADDLVLVCRLGVSSLPQLARLADVLEQNSVEPRGFVVVGTGDARSGNYYLDEYAERGPKLRLRGQSPSQAPSAELSTQ